VRVFRAALHGLLDLLAPRMCPGCDLTIGPGQVGFCGACEPLLELLDTRTGTNAVYAYGGPMGDAIRRLKYEARTDHVAALGTLLADACADLAGSVDVVVPIPLYPRRLRDRGFNQAALLARPVATNLGVPLDTRALQRGRDTRAQAGLDATSRASNVKGCFIASRVRDRRVLVIDDVRTTGATFTDAFRALRESGAIEVHGRALAGA
jgi:ComF family protein